MTVDKPDGGGHDAARKVVPLTSVEAGREVLVAKVDAGKGLARRLAEMGIFPGTRLRVLSSRWGGPLIIELGSARVGIGRGMASKISVR